MHREGGGGMHVHPVHPPLGMPMSRRLQMSKATLMRVLQLIGQILSPLCLRESLAIRDFPYCSESYEEGHAPSTKQMSYTYVRPSISG
jgi:hypothetical protein